jgi:hypothetical protein
MPNKDERQQGPPDDLDEGQELAEARALLQDPAQVAPVDTQTFGRRLSEILMRALRGRRRRAKPDWPAP